MSLKLNRTSFGNPEHTGNVLSQEEATALLKDWMKNGRLQLHMKQVGQLMKCWAQEKEGLNEADKWRWEMAGLLHDAD
jgi:predicted hydrolase (HD superfamily)